MTRDDVARWLDRYVEAWQSYDRDAIRALFSADAEYRYHPWDDPVRGADAIADDWIEDRDTAGTYSAAYAPFAVEGNRAVALGTSDYIASGDQPARRYHNAFFLEFDDAGACRSFTEIFLEQR